MSCLFVIAEYLYLFVCCVLGMGLSADDLAVDLAPINITSRVEDQLVGFQIRTIFATIFSFEF